MRIFVTGGTRILEDESLRGKSIEDVQGILRATYPEVASATIRTRTETDDSGQELQIVEFLPKPGRKG